MDSIFSTKMNLYTGIMGLFFMAGYGACSLFKTPSDEKIQVKDFPIDKKLSVSIESYVSQKGKDINDFDITQVYNCHQEIPRDIESIVDYSEHKEGFMHSCEGYAIKPKTSQRPQGAKNEDR